MDFLHFQSIDIVLALLMFVGAGCCGGPALTWADACCSQDEVAKIAGKSGCGCASTGACG